MANAFHLAVGDDRLATLTFDLPDSKVNIFNQAVVEELSGLIPELATRSEIGCLVLLSGKAKTFIAGADIDAIAGVTDPEEASAGSRAGQELFDAWSRLPFPTIAAIQGTAVGGGTEIALASTYRVASRRDDVRIGLPETRLGILPGWGGCVRLPQRIGIAAALDIILAGKSVHPKKALKLGLIDALFPDASFLHHVRDFARTRLDSTRRDPRRVKLQEKLLERNPLGRKVLFDQARKRTLAQTKGHYPAQPRALEVVRIGIEDGAEAGYRAEARAIGELAVSRESKNLVHLFKLMESSKSFSLEGVEPHPIAAAGVLGAGVMGGGIAQLLAGKIGCPVRLKDIAVDPLARAQSHAAGLFRKQVKRRRLTKIEARERLALIRPATEYSGFDRLDLVIEAIVEKLEIKQAVMADVAARVPADTILASNTSSLDIDEIARDVPNPERVVGMHFFNPVEKMPLVEVVVGDCTGQVATQTIVDLARRLGKTPVVVKSAPGFLVNRLLGFYMNGAYALLGEGATIEAIDRSMTDWGMPMGPITLSDEVGLDVGVEVAKILAAAFGERLPLPEWGELLAADPARLGAKTGSGFFFYEGRKRKGVDPAFYSILGLQPGKSSLSDDEMVDRMVLPMVNEAAHCLSERIVASPGELDLAMIMGTGFPPFRGGLCRWADSQGLGALCERMQALAGAVGSHYAPCSALQQAAASGGFYAHAWS